MGTLRWHVLLRTVCLKGRIAVVWEIGDECGPMFLFFLFVLMVYFVYIKTQTNISVRFSCFSAGCGVLLLRPVAMLLDVITATDDGLLSMMQRHGILRHGDSLHDSFSYRE